jgi:hypothetical protein
MYPIGPLPFALWQDWWAFSLMAPLAIAAETIVLWYWASRLGFLGNLWRAALLYAAARTGEVTAIWLLPLSSPFHRAGWSFAMAEIYGPVAVCVVCGVVMALPVGLLLYLWKGVKPGRVVAAVCTASAASYFSALAYGLLLVRARGF